MSESPKIVGRVSTRQTTPAQGDVGLREGAANPTYGGMVGDWKETTLGECAAWLSGGTPFKGNNAFWSGSIPWVSAKDMKIFRLHDAEDHISDIAIGNGGKVVPAGTILMLVRGMTLHNDVPICTVKREMAFNQDIKALRPANGVDGEFLAYWLLAHKPDLLASVDHAGHGTGRLVTDTLKHKSVRLPPLPEQKAIAHILGTLDDKIELNRRMNATLEAMARALFQSWFVDFDPVRAKLDGRKPAGLDAATAALFPAHFQESPLGHIPQVWEVKTVGEIGNVVCGKTPSTAVSDYYGNDIPFITIPDMHGNVFAASTGRKLSRSGADSQANKTLPPGSICVSCIATPGLVVITSENSQTNQQINSVVPHQRDESYFWYWVMTGLGAEIASSGSGGSVLANLSKGRFETLQVVNPPHVLIRAYHSSVRPLFENILANTHQSRTLGVSHVDTLQRTFVDAERQAKDSAQRALNAYLTKLAVFRDPAAKFDPQNLAQILARVSDAVTALGLEKLAQWTEAKIRLPLLKAMRPEANKEKIDALTRALVSLETPLPPDIGSDITTANALRQELVTLDTFSVDAPRSNIIAEAAGYLTKHPTETNCPLCEKKFDQPLADVLVRLKQRGDALRELRESVANRKAAVGRVQRYGEAVAAQIAKDLEHSALLEPVSKQTLRDARASTLRWLRSVKRAEGSSSGSDLAAPQRLSTLAASRSACATVLKAQKAALVPPDTSKLEAAIALVEKGIAAHAEIATAEGAIGGANELARRATVAKNAFSKARESAIQKVFEAIAKTVLDYYQRLHDVVDDSERSECTALELKPTSRAAAGGLRLAIQFLGLADSKDPRAFLSEGHLDSLGLCLFLATVRIFNPPGSLLVLDDVLTSIDREHRRRVGELLFQEFADYQIVLTTHDEHWHDLLNSSAQAWGIQGKWTFVTVKSWSVDSGPALSEVDSSWEFVDAHLTEADYRELGGPFRLILEDFIKRSAAKLEVKVRFKIDGKYTAGDFVTAGIQNTIRDALVKVAPADKMAICTEVGRVFGQGDFVNFLSHDNPGRLEVTFDQAKDFVQGLRDLTKRCEERKLIKGRQP